ncbi:hypothetical protein AAF712_012720 [Marasmius tenuissimus]|uniref:Uncharacterized protein n=1 Tax=Marasmius tenuissimus TaxID=585030 RepID=A0ABR2ZGX0_9AGAR
MPSTFSLRRLWVLGISFASVLAMPMGDVVHEKRALDQSTYDNLVFYFQCASRAFPPQECPLSIGYRCFFCLRIELCQSQRKHLGSSGAVVFYLSKRIWINPAAPQINDPATDTQGFIARDDNRQEIVVSLRGRWEVGAYLPV